MSARAGVVVFPGSCDEPDALLAVNRTPGFEAEYLWHAERDLKGSDAVVLPGGFSYGDYLRAGAIARFSPVMESVIAFAREGGPVLGICNGFQVLCEAGLLPGALLPTSSSVRLPPGARDGREHRDAVHLRLRAGGGALDPRQAHDRALLRAAGDARAGRGRRSGGAALRPGTNPNGSLRDIAGVANEQGNVFGLMPHPEHAADPLTGSTDGLRLFGSLARHLSPVPA